MKEVICVPGAKVPIVKVFDPVLKLACDMNVNNTLALENTRMIKTYVQIDPRVRPLAMIIKHWTKRRIVNDAGQILKFSIILPFSHLSSFWCNPQFIYLDMHDYQLPSKPKIPYPSIVTSETSYEASYQRRGTRELVCR